MQGGLSLLLRLLKAGMRRACSHHLSEQGKVVERSARGIRQALHESAGPSWQPNKECRTHTCCTYLAGLRQVQGIFRSAILLSEALLQLSLVDCSPSCVKQQQPSLNSEHCTTRQPARVCLVSCGGPSSIAPHSVRPVCHANLRPARQSCCAAQELAAVCSDQRCGPA